MGDTKSTLLYSEQVSPNSLEIGGLKFEFFFVGVSEEENLKFVLKHTCESEGSTDLMSVESLLLR